MRFSTITSSWVKICARNCLKRSSHRKLDQSESLLLRLLRVVSTTWSSPFHSSKKKTTCLTLRKSLSTGKTLKKSQTWKTPHFATPWINSSSTAFLTKINGQSSSSNSIQSPKSMNKMSSIFSSLANLGIKFQKFLLYLTKFLNTFSQIFSSLTLMVQPWWSTFLNQRKTNRHQELIFWLKNSFKFTMVRSNLTLSV